MVKEFMQRHFHYAAKSLQCLKRQHGMVAFYPRDVASQQAAALLYVSLREAFLFSDSSSPFANDHSADDSSIGRQTSQAQYRAGD